MLWKSRDSLPVLQRKVSSSWCEYTHKLKKLSTDQWLTLLQHIFIVSTVYLNTCNLKFPNGDRVKIWPKNVFFGATDAYFFFREDTNQGHQNTIIELKLFFLERHTMDAWIFYREFVKVYKPSIKSKWNPSLLMLHDLIIMTVRNFLKISYEKNLYI